LNDKGYDVNYTFEPSKLNSELSVYTLGDDRTKKIVFSNNKNLHGPYGAVIGYSIKPKIVEDIVKKIIS